MAGKGQKQGHRTTSGHKPDDEFEDTLSFYADTQDVYADRNPTLDKAILVKHKEGQKTQVQLEQGSALPRMPRVEGAEASKEKQSRNRYVRRTGPSNRRGSASK